MSKWINKDLFEDFQKEKIEEKETSSNSGFMRSNVVWQTPERGTVETPKVYEGRFLSDPNGKFYKKFYYHFWKTGENWNFVLCTKTHDFSNYCPFCSANNKLWNGTQQDKKHAYLLKRKEKFVGNFYIVKDNRDDDREEENKVINKVKIYEFPSKVEQKLKKEITNRDQGYGYQIFDPSEGGRNFIISVLSTKKDKNNNQWPDYSNSEFSRTQYALGDSDSEIKDIMDRCIDLEEYIKSMNTPKDKQVEILKNEFLWELVKDECLKYGYSDKEVGDRKDDSETKEKNKPSQESRKESESSPQEESQSDDNEHDDSGEEDIDDDDLLKELDNM